MSDSYAAASAPKAAPDSKHDPNPVTATGDYYYPKTIGEVLENHSCKQSNNKAYVRDNEQDGLKDSGPVSNSAMTSTQTSSLSEKGVARLRFKDQLRPALTEREQGQDEPSSNLISAEVVPTLPIQCSSRRFVSRTTSETMPGDIVRGCDGLGLGRDCRRCGGPLTSERGQRHQSVTDRNLWKRINRKWYLLG
jgi:hypothetical protein